MSPPIIWQSLRVIESPSPVPPYLRVVERSACENGRKIFFICSSVMPMPESRTRKLIQSCPA
jgi:hypothetical protein